MEDALCDALGFEAQQEPEMAQQKPEMAQQKPEMAQQEPEMAQQEPEMAQQKPEMAQDQLQPPERVDTNITTEVFVSQNIEAAPAVTGDDVPSNMQESCDVKSQHEEKEQDVKAEGTSKSMKLSEANLKAHLEATMKSEKSN